MFNLKEIIDSIFLFLKEDNRNKLIIFLSCVTIVSLYISFTIYTRDIENSTKNINKLIEDCANEKSLMSKNYYIKIEHLYEEIALIKRESEAKCDSSTNAILLKKLTKNKQQIDLAYSKLIYYNDELSKAVSEIEYLKRKIK